MDPFQYNIFANGEDDEKIHFDVFKNDIYAMGLTLIELATGKRFKTANNKEEEFE